MKFCVYITILFLIGCGPTKSIDNSKVEVSKTDISYALSTLNEISINQLCDSITGMPVQFDTKSNNSVSDSRVRTEGNKLIIEIKTDTVYKDSIVYKDKLVTSITKEVKTVWSKWTWFFLGGLVVCFVFPSIPKFLHGLVIKLFI